MSRTLEQLREDALAIWNAGVAGVRSEELVRSQVEINGDELRLGESYLDLDEFDRLLILGAGKAGAGMLAGLTAALGEQLLRAKRTTGWINVPADCARPDPWVTLHPARPAGINEPTAAGVVGSRRILELAAHADPRTLCVVLLSGGASALLPAPRDGVTLEDKQRITRALAAAGADIRELNTVRKHLSAIKGGRLAQQCRAGRLVTLVLSDVLGDPLDLIGSGPTVADPTTPRDAVTILDRYAVWQAGVSQQVRSLLLSARDEPRRDRVPGEVHVIGNNAVAVDCAGIEAERRGYSHAMLSAREPEGPVEQIGEHMARQALQMRSQAGPDCLILGGEGTVRLSPAAERGRGGRNQQTVLAALTALGDHPPDDVVILSGGTDGEDGPTDAAGGWVDAQIAASARAMGIDPRDHLRRNDAYTFLERTGGLLKTGPTHTNVCDVRVVVVGRIAHLGERS